MYKVTYSTVDIAMIRSQIDGHNPIFDTILGYDPSMLRHIITVSISRVSMV